MRAVFWPLLALVACSTETPGPVERPTDASRPPAVDETPAPPPPPPDAGDAGDAGATSACAADGKKFYVTALSDRSYYIDGAVDPTLTLCRGRSYTFQIRAPYHPFYVKTTRAPGVANAYDVGVTNNGAQSGDVVVKLAPDAPPLLHYQCAPHPEMGGDLGIVDAP